MAFPINKRDAHFEMLRNYYIQQFGEELGIKNYSEWLEKNGYDDSQPMIKQRGLKSLSFALENVTRKTKGDNPLLKAKNKVLEAFKKTAMSKDLQTGELYRYRKKIEQNMQDIDLVQQFDQLGNAPNQPTADELRALRKNYSIATQFAPTSIQARGAKDILSRITEKLINEKKATRAQIEKFL